jgi:hypothetical protein
MSTVRQIDVKSEAPPDRASPKARPATIIYSCMKWKLIFFVPLTLLFSFVACKEIEPKWRYRCVLQNIKVNWPSCAAALDILVLQQRLANWRLQYMYFAR